MLKYLLLYVVGFVYGAKVVDYCRKDLQCTIGKHTLCDQPCEGEGIPVPHDLKWRERSLYWHNYFRNQLAGGNDTQGGNSAASNMRALSYDMGLEFTAACWLYINNKMQHDNCRGTPKFPIAGQNLWQGPADPRVDVNIKNFVWAWYSEANDTSKKQIDNYEPHIAEHRPDGKEIKIEDFTQLCWAETTHVGCARSLMRPRDRLYLVGCNYGPQGNTATRPVYKRGKGASACPGGMKANKEFPNLCGEIEPMPPEASNNGLPELDVRRKEGIEKENRKKLKKAYNNASIVKKHFIKYLVFVAFFTVFD